MAKSARSGTVYQLKITLQGIRPPVWRRVQLKDCSLTTLNEVIQTVLGWDDMHLHSFTVGGVEYGDPEQMDDPEEQGDEGSVKLSKIVSQRRKKFSYVYDFGDNWEHTIEVEKTLPAEAGVSYPRCVAGKRAGPPEDCGGPWGYAEFLAAIADPKHEQHEEMLEWVGDEFDPEAFDRDAMNEELKGLGE